jgi:hypothetical protein
LDDRKHAFIVGSINCSQLSGPKLIRFLVDTGASFSTILGYDVLRLGIDCSKLKTSSCSFSTANGRRTAFQLDEVEVTLYTNDVPSQVGSVTFSLKNMPCFTPPATVDASVVAEEAYSVLGMDVLFLFKNWTYTDSVLVLESGGP